MPQSISIETSVFQIKSKQELFGVAVPWDATGYLEDLVAAETVGGVFDLSSWSTLKIDGKDAKDFLQRMSTVNFKTWVSDGVSYGAFLTGKGTVISLGQFLEDRGAFYYIVT